MFTFCKNLLHYVHLMYIIKMEANMDYKKEDLIDIAMERLETVDDILHELQTYISALGNERQLVRYLLFLATKDKKYN